MTDNVKIEVKTNKEKMNDKSFKSANVKQEINWKNLAITFMIVSFVFAFFIILNNGSNLQKEDGVLELLMLTELDEYEVIEDETTANRYYDLADLCYEEQDYKCVESNCKIARGYFSKSAQGYHDIKAKVIDKELDHEIINIYVSMLNENANQNYNMFEACEYFESASRYYNIYFNTNVPYDDSSFEMGGEQIDAMSKKILAHDESVIRYNKLLSKY